MNKTILFGLLALLSNFSLPVAAESDGKVYPASQCQVANREAFDNSVIKKSQIDNYGTKRITLICPIVKDLYSGRKDGVYSVWVKIIDNNPTPGEKVHCGIYSRLSNGSYVDSSWVSFANGGSTTPQHLNIPNSIDTRADGLLLLSCSLPPVYGSPSSLISYRVNERD